MNCHIIFRSKTKAFRMAYDTQENISNLLKSFNLYCSKLKEVHKEDFNYEAYRDYECKESVTII